MNHDEEAMYFPAFDDFDLDERESALAVFFMRLQFMDARLEAEFSAMVDSWKLYNELGIAIQAEADAAVADAMESMLVAPAADSAPIALTLPIIYTSAWARGEIREQSARLCAETAAGSLILMLDDVFQRLRSCVDSTSSPTPASKFRIGAVGAGSVSTLLYAGGNAYRHLRDWDGLIDSSGIADPAHRQFGRARPSIELLREAVDLKAVWSSSICVETIRAICVVSGSGFCYESLSDALHGATSDFASRYCNSGEASLSKVHEALEHQNTVTSMEISYTRNERLFE